MTKIMPRQKFVAVVLFMIIVNVGIGKFFLSYNDMTWRLTAWLVTIPLLCVCFAIVGKRMANDWRGVLVDKRKVISLSRLQLIIWTIIVTSGILTAGVANIFTGAAEPLKLVIPQQIWWLLGISGTSFVATPLILGRNPDDVAQNDTNAWEWADIFTGDSKDNQYAVDLSKVQQFFFTVIVVTVYAVEFAQCLLQNDASHKVIFPKVDDGLVALLAISHAAYLANKTGNLAGGTAGQPQQNQSQQK